MSKWTQEKREQMKERVREVLICEKPNASKYELARILGIDQKTALKLKKEIIKENISRISKQKVSEEIGKLEDEANQLALKCWQVIDDDTRKVKKMKNGQLTEVEVSISISDKLKAIRTLRGIRTKQFDIKLVAGVFSQKEAETEEELSKEDKELITRAIEFAQGKGNNTN
jgi:DNA-binding CsgD family transcriptional regulator